MIYPSGWSHGKGLNQPNARTSRQACRGHLVL
jgi:hypothetical protein